MSKEQPKEQPSHKMMNDETQDALEAMLDSSFKFDPGLSEGKVISIHQDKREELSLEVLKSLQQKLADINAHLADVEQMKEGFALMKKRDKNYADLKEDLDRELKALPEMEAQRQQIEQQLLAPTDIAELRKIRSKEMVKLEEEAVAKVRSEINREIVLKETALVSQSQEEKVKHKDWGAWRGPVKYMSMGQKIAFPLFGFPVDVINWTYRKIKRLMGKGAELDGEEKKVNQEIDFESFIENELFQQYETQKNIFRQAGLIEELKNGELGLKGIDGQEYPLPTAEEISQRLNEKKDLFREKVAQGFSQLLIVPFGMSLDELVKKASAVILKHYRAGKFFATKKNQNNPKEKLKPLDLDTNQPLWTWNNWKNSDVNDQCVYYPQALIEKNHQGKTKTAILKQQKKAQSPLAGWDVLLTEANMNLPKAGQGQTMNGRKQLEANQKPEQYLKQLQTKSEYQNEQGLTNEAWLTLLITHLEKTNQVIDDWQGNGKACYLPGSFFPSSRVLGSGCWSRDFRQAYLNRTDAGYVNSGGGFRSAVGI